MKTLFFVSIAMLLLSLNTIAQDKPVYSMSKDNPVIFEPEETERDTKNDEDRFTTSMYKDQIFIEKNDEDNPPPQSEKPKSEGEKTPTLLRKEKE